MLDIFKERICELERQIRITYRECCTEIKKIASKEKWLRHMT